MNDAGWAFPVIVLVIVIGAFSVVVIAETLILLAGGYSEPFSREL